MGDSRGSRGMFLNLGNHFLMGCFDSLLLHLEAVSMYIVKSLNKALEISIQIQEQFKY